MAPGQADGRRRRSIEIAVSSDYPAAALCSPSGSNLASIQGCHQPLSIAENMFRHTPHPFSVGISERIEGPSDDHD